MSRSISWRPGGGIESAERLGADETARASARALADGNALCVTTGQQPGLFLGPLYTVYKIMTAVALARRVEEKSGERTVPVFWNASDDSDFCAGVRRVICAPDCAFNELGFHHCDTVADS